MLELVDVVAVDRSDVLQSEVLEHALRGHHVLEALLHAVQRVEERLTDNRGPVEHRATPVEEPFVAAGRAQRRQMVSQAADGRCIRALVVVDDDDDGAVLRHGEVVEGLPGHAAGQGAVADDGHDRAAPLVPQVERLGDAIGIRQSRRGVRVLDDVVLGLGT